MRGTAGDERVEIGQVVGTGGQVGQQRTDPAAALSVTAEPVEALAEHADFAEERVDFALAHQALAIEFFESRLVVECVDLADSTGRKHVDATLGAGGCVWCVQDAAGCRSVSEAAVLVEQAGQRDGTDPAGHLAAEGASGLRVVDGACHRVLRRIEKFTAVEQCPAGVVQSVVLDQGCQLPAFGGGR